MPAKDCNTLILCLQWHWRPDLWCWFSSNYFVSTMNTAWVQLIRYRDRAFDIVRSSLFLDSGPASSIFRHNVSRLTPVLILISLWLCGSSLLTTWLGLRTVKATNIDLCGKACAHSSKGRGSLFGSTMNRLGPPRCTYQRFHHPTDMLSAVWHGPTLFLGTRLSMPMEDRAHFAGLTIKIMWSAFCQ